MRFLDTLRDSPKRTLLGIVLLIAGGSFFIDWVVVTDEEKIEAILLDALEAYMARDVEGVLSVLASDYASSTVTRSRIRMEVRTPRVADAALRLGTVTFVEGNPDLASALVVARGRDQQGGYDLRPLYMDFRREAGEWRIKGIELHRGM